MDPRKNEISDSETENDYMRHLCNEEKWQIQMKENSRHEDVNCRERVVQEREEELQRREQAVKKGEEELKKKKRGLFFRSTKSYP